MYRYRYPQVKLIHRLELVNESVLTSVNGCVYDKKKQLCTEHVVCNRVIATLSGFDCPING